jgi:putative transposase
MRYCIGIVGDSLFHEILFVQHLSIGWLRLLKQGSEAFGFRRNRWTARRVAVVIASMFGVHSHPEHVRKLLHALGWSPQRTRERAIQRNETVIVQWQQQYWPAQKKPKANEEPCFL